MEEIEIVVNPSDLDINVAIENKVENKNKYGATIDDMLGNVSQDGVYERPQKWFVVDLSGIKKIPIVGLQYAFYARRVKSVIASTVIEVLDSGLRSTFEYCGLESVDFSSLVSVGNYGLSNAFSLNTNLSSIDFSSLQTIKAGGLASAFAGCYGIEVVDFRSLTTVEQYGLQSAFDNCIGIKHVNLGSLQTVGEYGFQSAFVDCRNLTSVDLGSLTTIGSYAFSSAFNGCSKLAKISFPSLIGVQTNSFGTGSYNFAFAYYTNLTEIHFRADMRATIETMSGYDSKWGATNASIIFDL